MYEQELRQRLDALFAEIDRLSADPACNSPSIRQEIDDLRVRLCRMEAEVARYERPVSEVEAVLPSERNEAGKPVDRSSTTTTSRPDSSNRRATWEPM